MIAPVLSGGPYDIHILLLDTSPHELRFPAEPLLDMNGKPSVCAPRPNQDGPIVYRHSGRVNVFGNPIYVFQEGGRG